MRKVAAVRRGVPADRAAGGSSTQARGPAHRRGLGAGLRPRAPVQVAVLLAGAGGVAAQQAQVGAAGAQLTRAPARAGRVQVPLHVHEEQVLPGHVGQRPALDAGEVDPGLGEHLQGAHQGTFVVVHPEQHGGLAGQARVRRLRGPGQEHEAGLVAFPVGDAAGQHLQPGRRAASSEQMAPGVAQLPKRALAPGTGRRRRCRSRAPGARPPGWTGSPRTG